MDGKGLAAAHGEAAGAVGHPGALGGEAAAEVGRRGGQAACRLQLRPVLLQLLLLLLLFPFPSVLGPAPLERGPVLFGLGFRVAEAGRVLVVAGQVVVEAHVEFGLPALEHGLWLHID